MKENLEEAVESLNQALESYKYETDEVPRVVDIYLPLNHLFNQAAKKAFQFQVKGAVNKRTIEKHDGGKVEVIDKVRYFMTEAVGEREIFNSAQKIANEINSLALKGYVTGALLKLGMIKLSTEPHELERYMVVSYVSINKQGSLFLEKNPSLFESEYK